MKLDQEKIKKLEEKLRQAGIDVRYRKRGELRLQKCPLHKDKTPSLTINVEENRFRCQSCDFRGTLTKLLKEYGIDYHYSGYYVPTIDELEQLLNDSLSSEKSAETTEEAKSEEYTADPSELKNYRYYHPYLESRGFAREFILANKIGFDKKELRVTIPIILDGIYWGCAKRSVVGDIPKIKYAEGMPKQNVLYLPLTNTGNSDILITEGPIDALKASLYGYDSVAILGCNVSERQINLITELSKKRKVILALDNDDAGRAGAEKFLKQWDNFDIKIFSYKENIKDIGDMDKDSFLYGVENCRDLFEY